MRLFILLITFSFTSWSLELKVGDILLQPLHCYACNLIEAQTQSEYSHIGVVIKKEEGNVFVAEAFGKVKVVSFKKFNQKTQKGLMVEVLRPRYVNHEIYTTYLNYFDSKPYDSNFLWSDEKIYCSELVQKLFVKLSMTAPKEKPMTFDINRELWDKFFRGNTPEGHLGISPVDFKNSNLYIELGFYEN